MNSSSQLQWLHKQGYVIFYDCSLSTCHTSTFTFHIIVHFWQLYTFTVHNISNPDPSPGCLCFSQFVTTSTFTFQGCSLSLSVWPRPQSWIPAFTCQKFSVTLKKYSYFSQIFTFSVAQTPILDACSQEEIDRMSKEVKPKLNQILN